MSTVIKKTGTLYLRPSVWYNQGDFTSDETPGILYHKSGWFGGSDGPNSVNEVTADNDATTIWTYCTSFGEVQTGDGTFTCGNCNEIPIVPYTITSLTVKGVGYIQKRTGVWSSEPTVHKLALTVTGDGGSDGDGTSGGLNISYSDWTSFSKSISTSVLSSTSISANTIPDLKLRVYNRCQGKWNSGQFYQKITQIYIEVAYEYNVTVDVNNSSYGKISGYTGGGSSSTITINAATIGSGDIYFAGWYTNYSSGGKEHYQYTNKVGSDLTYVWTETNPYPQLYAVWYDYPIQIAAGNKRVKHIYRGKTEITSVYRGNTKIYWPGAVWEEINE